jgi:hypothetical protein
MMTPFIVGLQENYGVHFSICLVLFRLCLEVERDVGELERTNGKTIML